MVEGGEEPVEQGGTVGLIMVGGVVALATWCGYGVLAHNLVKVARLEATNA